jgi:hypothetical protein
LTYLQWVGHEYISICLVFVKHRLIKEFKILDPLLLAATAIATTALTMEHAAV